MIDHTNTTFICKNCGKEEISLLNYGNQCYDCADETFERGPVKAIVIIILFVMLILSTISSYLVTGWIFPATM